ncbi:hypothetical protein [Lysobacter hankyongensis]|uniref:Uncharacterized protein n=1 Tax=Lysobacter hankyongensis TaxID=1176535 RepID=A0ABP9BK66_9GAMM
MYDRALIDRTLLAIAIASTAPVSPARSPVFARLKAWLRRRLTPASAPRIGEQPSG